MAKGMTLTRAQYKNVKRMDHKQMETFIVNMYHEGYEDGRKRLIKRKKCRLSHGEEIVICSYDEENCNDYCMRIIHCKWYKKAMERLKEYEDLEEQGLLLKLPCKTGDTVYVKLASHCKEKYVEAEVRGFVHFAAHGFCIVVRSEYFGETNIPFTQFSKTVFLTKEEARENDGK